MGTAIAPKENEKMEKQTPFFVEAEKLFEEFAETTKKIAKRAYHFFENRGGGFGSEFDDWFKAESEILRKIPVEMTETDKEINLKADVAGFKPEEIKISVLRDQLIMSGKSESESKRDDEKTLIQEWKSNQFFRQFTLPAEVNAENVEAKLQDGVLQLTLPKAPSREAANISVKAV